MIELSSTVTLSGLVKQNVEPWKPPKKFVEPTDPIERRFWLSGMNDKDIKQFAESVRKAPAGLQSTYIDVLLNSRSWFSRPIRSGKTFAMECLRQFGEVRGDSVFDSRSLDSLKDKPVYNAPDYKMSRGFASDIDEKYREHLLRLQDSGPIMRRRMIEGNWISLHKD